MIRRLSYFLFVALLLFRLASAQLYIYITQPYLGFKQSGKIININPGITLEQVSKLLYSEGVIPNQSLFKGLVISQGKANKIMAGEYYFPRGSSLITVSNKLIKGEIYLRRFTIPEGADLLDVADIIQKNGICSREEFLRLASDIRYIADLAPSAESLEGFLFPDTYYFPRGVKPEKLIMMMCRQFKKVFNSLKDLRAQSSMQQPLEVVTLASLIEKETSIQEEKSLISSVFHNRLRRNFPLQCDPTIIYALKRENRYDGNLKRVHLKMPSPYNTYLHPGLPPGPICNPGIESLRAALCSPKTDYLYFVSKNDGSHHFSLSIKEHNRAVAKYQKLYWEIKWKKNKKLN